MNWKALAHYNIATMRSSSGKKKLQKFSEFNIVIIQILTIDTFESKIDKSKFSLFLIMTFVK